MKSCGLIVEYNPFHNGHLYHMQQARKQTKADILIAVMSGNFLQRGEPAILDKWSRAKMALDAGADLVIELPVSFSVQPADFFAKGGVALLQAMGCEQLCFSAESGTSKDYLETAGFFLDHSKEIDQRFQQFRNDGGSYAAQMQHVMDQFAFQYTLDFSAPNTMLGVAYAKENAAYKKPMQLHVIRREGAEYHESQLVQKKLASATAIRKALMESETRESGLEKVADFLPLTSSKALADHEFMSWQNLWPLLKYQIIVQPVEELNRIYQMNEGIEYRLKEMAKKADNFQHFVATVKTKRLTWVRIQRLCVYVLLQMKKEEMASRLLHGPQAIRVLGFNQMGRDYLNQTKKIAELPIITNLNQKNHGYWQLDIRAGEIFNLGFSNAVLSQDYRRHPIHSF